MEYEDRIYGKVEIGESVILDLLESPSLQRMKGIYQHGHFEPYFPGSRLSRFEHSVGVFILLKIFGARLEEQTAGLIHDVSHTVFSHCGDYIYNKAGALIYQTTVCYNSEINQDFQDSYHKRFVEESEIPEILRKHGINYKFILDDSKFPLKEKPLPDLCADRIDYSLRTALVFREINSAEYFLGNLTAENGRWIFKNFESAKKYAELFLKLNTNYYAGLPSAVMFRTVGDYLRLALLKGYISENDFYATDKIVLSNVVIITIYSKIPD